MVDNEQYVSKTTYLIIDLLCKVLSQLISIRFIYSLSSTEI